MVDQDKSNMGIWVATRVTFYVLIATWSLAGIFLSVSEDNLIGYVLSVITVLVMIPVFVLSIIHLNKYPDKGLAITALVISSIGIIIMLFSL